MEFTTICDVETWYYNSGICDWEWFEGFSPGDLIRYIWKRYNGTSTNEYGESVFCTEVGDIPVDHVISAYLREHGENPADYSLDEA